MCFVNLNSSCFEFLKQLFSASLLPKPNSVDLTTSIQIQNFKCKRIWSQIDCLVTILKSQLEKWLKGVKHFKTEVSCNRLQVSNQPLTPNTMLSDLFGPASWFICYALDLGHECLIEHVEL